MENYNLKKDFQKEQFNNQVNSAYMGTIIVSFIFAFVFYFYGEITILTISSFMGVVVGFSAIYLSRSGKYGLGSLVYIGYISLVTIFEIQLLGFEAGFQYTFFSLVGLIMYTNWSTWQKVSATAFDVLLFIIVFFLNYDKVPPIQLSYGLISFFNVSNILFNILGVSSSAFFYVDIASTTLVKIHKLAVKDYLTNLMNRVSFDEYIDEAFLVRKEKFQNLAILMLDIDHFKNINDSYGHLCGDEILRQLGSILNDNVEEGQCAARYGGEEFIFVLNNFKSPEEARMFSKNLRHEVEKHKFKCSEEEKQITVSIGMVYISPNVDIDKYEALQYVDELLYRAKSEGRNRVVFQSIS